MVRSVNGRIFPLRPPLCVGCWRFRRQPCYPSSLDMLNPCVTKQQLLMTWQMAAQGYSASVNELVKQLGHVAPTEYMKLKRKTERERLRTIDARTEFEKHCEEHGC